MRFSFAFKINRLSVTIICLTQDCHNKICWENISVHCDNWLCFCQDIKEYFCSEYVILERERKEMKINQHRYTLFLITNYLLMILHSIRTLQIYFIFAYLKNLFPNF